MLIAKALSGKAARVYEQLLAEELNNYEVLKERVLLSYGRVPGFYRNNYVNCKKSAHEDFTEYAFRRASLFDKWMEALKCEKSYSALRQTILCEDFIKSIDSKLQDLDFKCTTDLQKMAEICDVEVARQPGKYHQAKSNQKPHQKPMGQSAPDHEKPKQDDKKSEQNHGKKGGKGGKGGPNKGSHYPGKLTCTYCSRQGHSENFCWMKNPSLKEQHNASRVLHVGEGNIQEEKSQEKRGPPQQTKPQGSNPPSSHSHSRKSGASGASKGQPRQDPGASCYLIRKDTEFPKEFVSEATIMRPSKDGTKACSQPEEILCARDSCASVSCVSREMLPHVIMTNERVALRGITGATFSAPIGITIIDSDFYVGTLRCAVVPKFSDSVQVLIGNDILGAGKSESRQTISQVLFTTVPSLEFVLEEGGDAPTFRSCVYTTSEEDELSSISTTAKQDDCNCAVMGELECQIIGHCALERALKKRSNS